MLPGVRRGLGVAATSLWDSDLLSLGLLRERHDLAASGGAGRPRVPFDIDTTSYAALGVHIGVASTQIVAVDLTGRVLGRAAIATPSRPQAEAMAVIAQEAHEVVSRLPHRNLLWVGIASTGHVKVNEGVVEHGHLGWEDAPAVAVFGNFFGVPVSVAAHVEAMAAAELLLWPNNPLPRDQSTSILYVYVRETVGAAIILHDRVHIPSNGPGTISHLPTNSGIRCPCGRTGCLEITVADSSVLRQAIERNILPPGRNPRKASIGDLYEAALLGSEPARDLLDTRAEVLGSAIALVSDVFHADRIILAGQAVTAYEPGTHRLRQAVVHNTALSPADVSMTRFGNRIQEASAVVTALNAFYFAPLTAARRSRIAAKA